MAKSEQIPDESPEGGGGGGGSSGPMFERHDNIRGDMRMIEQAIRNRWPVDPKIRDALFAKVGDIGLSTSDPRAVMAACRVYLEAERMNQADEHKQQASRLELTMDSGPVSADQQRQAILRAIEAERRKRNGSSRKHDDADSV